MPKRKRKRTKLRKPPLRKGPRLLRPRRPLRRSRPHPLPPHLQPLRLLLRVLALRLRPRPLPLRPRFVLPRPRSSVQLELRLPRRLSLPLTGPELRPLPHVPELRLLEPRLRRPEHRVHPERPLSLGLAREFLCAHKRREPPVSHQLRPERLAPSELRRLVRAL